MQNSDYTDLLTGIPQVDLGSDAIWVVGSISEGWQRKQRTAAARGDGERRCPAADVAGANELELWCSVSCAGITKAKWRSRRTLLGWRGRRVRDGDSARLG
jgi:hypothetical protein